MATRSDQLEKELAMVKLEEQFLAAKAKAKKDPKKYRELKYKFDAARQAFREARESDEQYVPDGDAVAHPVPARATARARSVGGK